MEYRITMNDNTLAHHGIKGMKWGHRKQNENYNEQQRKRDAPIYGKRGVNRINDSMNKGNSISVARGDEKTRRDRVRSKSKYVRQGGKFAGVVAGVGAGIAGGRLINSAAKSFKGQAVLNKVLGAEGGAMASAVLSNPMVMGVAAAGAARVADMMAGDVAVSVYERSHGYKPYRK